MQIVPVDECNIHAAAEVHAAAWRESHRKICSPEFVAAHTTERQADYIRREMSLGKRFFLLLTDEPVGVAAVMGCTISDLYVHPAHQRKGHGTRLLTHVMTLCADTPVLWVLNTNPGAKRLYERVGFAQTGQVKNLSSDLCEVEMRYEKG